MNATADMVSRKRTGVEIGLVLSVTGMLLGLAFNAGIQYARINQMDQRTTALETEYQNIVNSQVPIQVRLERIETLVSTIQATQGEIKQAVENRQGAQVKQWQR